MHTEKYVHFQKLCAQSVHKMCTMNKNIFNIMYLWFVMSWYRNISNTIFVRDYFRENVYPFFHDFYPTFSKVSHIFTIFSFFSKNIFQENKKNIEENWKKWKNVFPKIVPGYHRRYLPLNSYPSIPLCNLTRFNLTISITALVRQNNDEYDYYAMNPF